MTVLRSVIRAAGSGLRTVCDWFNGKAREATGNPFEVSSIGPENDDGEAWIELTSGRKVFGRPRVGLCFSDRGGRILDAGCSREGSSALKRREWGAAETKEGGTP